MAGGWRVDAEVTGEEGQQAHRRKFGGADGEGANRQREKDKGGVRLMGACAHGVAPCCNAIKSERGKWFP